MEAEHAQALGSGSRWGQEQSPSVQVPSLNRPFRACDRCRLRKSRCRSSQVNLDGPCDGCFQAGEQCRFDLPVNRRGPKARRKTLSQSRTHMPILARPASPQSTSQSTSSGASPSQRHFTACEDATAAATLRSLAGRYSSPPYLSSSRTDAYLSLAGEFPDYQQPSVVAPINDLAGLGAPANSQSLDAEHQGNSVLCGVWARLSTQLGKTGSDALDIMHKSVNLFFEYLYPLTPLVHEPSIRKVLADLEHTSSPRPLDSQCSGYFLKLRPGLADALLTSIAATSAFFLPADIFPDGKAIAESLLAVSRNCLNDFIEEDLLSPSAASIAVRYFHSNCLHAAGKPRHSWILFGEASRLAQAMRLYDESALAELVPVEAELRRRNFWILYMGDKSAAILNNRPITMHKYSFESGITTSYPSPLYENQMSSMLLRTDASSPGSANTPRAIETVSSHVHVIIEGFNANLKLWQISSDILLELRMINERWRELRNRDDTIGSTEEANNADRQTITASERSRLEDLNIQFVTCLDTLPSCLRSCRGTCVRQGPDSIHAGQYTVQCVNLQVSVHSLRMILAEKLEATPLQGLPGMTYSDLQKTEIARDMLRVVQEAPFWSLQVNGEPCVEKIRLIGASLLKIIASNGSSPIAARARTDCLTLLNVLAKLDSRASDSLRNDPAWDR